MGGNDHRSEVKCSMGLGDDGGHLQQPKYPGLWPTPHLSFGLPTLVLQERRLYSNWLL